MSVSEFQISLEGEEDLMDSLKETVRNSNKCLEAIMKRKKLQEEGIGLIEHDPIAMIK